MTPSDTNDKPVVAILTIDDEIQLFRGNRQNFADLLLTGERLGFITYVVTVKNLKLRAPRVLGYTYQKDGEIWVKAWFPRPNVVYNRIPQREDERLPRVKRKLERLANDPSIRMFNRRFFNKWSLFKWLHDSRTTKSFIPETKKLTEPAVLSTLLKRHRLLYLKPVRGKAGVGIMTVKVQPEKNLPYRLQIQEEKGSTTFRCASLRRLWIRIRKQSAVNGQPYIAQQGIGLASVKQRPFDLRALVQKNGKGRWSLTGIAVRQGAPGSVTSNLHGGGHAEEAEPFLRKLYGKAAADILQTVRDIALRVPEVLETHHGRLAELGVDIGVDAEGRVWVLEANSKPGRSSFAALPDKQASRDAIVNPLLYAKYLLDTRGPYAAPPGSMKSTDAIHDASDAI